MYHTINSRLRRPSKNQYTMVTKTTSFRCHKTLLHIEIKIQVNIIVKPTFYSDFLTPPQLKRPVTKP